MVQKIAILIAATLVISALFIFAYYKYPVMGGDPMFFLPVAVNFASGNGLINISTEITSYFNDKFIYYPPLYPIIIGSLLSQPYNSNVYYVLAFINSLIIILSSVLFYKVAVFHKKEINWFTAIVIILNIIGTASILLQLNGRPENLAQLILVIGLIYGIFNYSSKYFLVIEGILLGIMGAIHPVSFILSAIFVGLVYFTAFNFKEAARKTFSTYFVSLIIFLGILQLSPYGIYDTIFGIVKHASLLFNSGNNFTIFSFIKDFAHYYFLLPWASFFGFLLILSIILIFHIFILNRKKIISLFPFMLFGILAMIMEIYVLTMPGRVYYNLLLFPFFAAIIIYYFSNIAKNFYIKFVIGITSVMVVVGFARGIALFPYFLKYGISLNAAQSHFSEMRKEFNGENIGISTSLWLLSDDYKNLYIWPNKIVNPDVIFYQQNHSGLIKSPQIEGCVIIYDSFVDYQPKVLGIKLANTMPGYAFAAYKCDKKGSL